MRILNCVIDTEDAAYLVAALTADGGADALTAAAEISWAVEWNTREIGLTETERNAVIGCLGDAPTSLHELRSTLTTARDNRAKARETRVRGLPRKPPTDGSIQCANCLRGIRRRDLKMMQIPTPPAQTSSDDDVITRTRNEHCPHCVHHMLTTFIVY